jgi:hypothetical protein
MNTQKENDFAYFSKTGKKRLHCHYDNNGKIDGRGDGYVFDDWKPTSDNVLFPANIHKVSAQMMYDKGFTSETDYQKHVKEQIDYLSDLPEW